MLQYSTLLYKKNILSDYLNDEIHNLLDKTFIIPKDFAYNIFEVTDEYIARPDLISLDAYGDTNFADVICKINGISNPFELNEGMKLIIPSPENIMDFTIEPSQDDIEKDDMQLPISKQKNEKRKVNEAIVGDSRFKIDSTNGIIIY